MVKLTLFTRIWQVESFHAPKTTGPAPAGTMWRSHKLFASIRWMKWARWDVILVGQRRDGGKPRDARPFDMWHIWHRVTYRHICYKNIIRMPPWTFHFFETENVNSWDFQFCQVSPQVAEKFTLTLKKARALWAVGKNELQVWANREYRDIQGQRQELVNHCNGQTERSFNWDPFRGEWNLLSKSMVRFWGIFFRLRTQKTTVAPYMFLGCLNVAPSSSESREPWCELLTS